LYYYGELSAAETIDYFAFPFGYPRQGCASDAGLSNFKSIIMEGKEVDRSRHCQKWFCQCFSSPDEQRCLFDVFPAI
jgi:hypothetical protein